MYSCSVGNCRFGLSEHLGQNVDQLWKSYFRVGGVDFWQKVHCSGSFACTTVFIQSGHIHDSLDVAFVLLLECECLGLAALTNMFKDSEFSKYVFELIEVFLSFRIHPIVPVEWCRLEVITNMCVEVDLL